MVIQLNSLYLNFSEPDYFFLICVVSTEDSFAPSEDIWQYLEMFLVITTGGGMLLASSW